MLFKGKSGTDKKDEQSSVTEIIRIGKEISSERLSQTIEKKIKDQSAENTSKKSR